MFVIDDIILGAAIGSALGLGGSQLGLFGEDNKKKPLKSVLGGAAIGAGGAGLLGASTMPVTGAAAPELAELGMAGTITGGMATPAQMTSLQGLGLGASGAAGLEGVAPLASSSGLNINKMLAIQKLAGMVQPPQQPQQQVQAPASMPIQQSQGRQINQNMALNMPYFPQYRSLLGGIYG
jgi:hypothetical protein